MSKCNPDNERIKRAYFEYQKEAKQRSQSTIDNIRQCILRYEIYSKYEDFKRFNKQRAIAFKKHFAQVKSSRAGIPLSKSTLLSTIRNLKDFFIWLAYRPGYKRIDVREVEYLNLSESDVKIARSRKRLRVPTIDQIKAVVKSMPTDNEIQLRDRALIAFTLLTGMRDSAIASLQLKHVKLSEGLVEQLPAEVKTKFGKTIYSYFFPIDDEFKKIFTDWVEYLYKRKLFTENDPVFPRTKIALDSNGVFASNGVVPIHWKSANQIRKIFEEAFERAGLEYYTPHTFRNTLSRLGEQICRNPEEFKAWSQNLGHANVMTTFFSYGNIEEYKQGEIIKSLSAEREVEKSNPLLEISKKLDTLIDLKNKP